MRYACIEAYRTEYPIELMCRALQVSRSGYFAWRHRQDRPRPDADTQVREKLQQVHQRSRRLYGRCRLTHALRARGHHINPKHVRRLMHQEGLHGVSKAFCPTHD